MSPFGAGIGLTRTAIGDCCPGRLLCLFNKLEAELSDKAGLNPNTILNAECGANPRLETIVRMLRALNRLAALDAFLPPPDLSPLQPIELRGKQRRRASRPRNPRLY
jgi:transcriptional regulator with XRE-family HTH domain